MNKVLDGEQFEFMDKFRHKFKIRSENPVLLSQ